MEPDCRTRGVPIGQSYPHTPCALHSSAVFVVQTSFGESENRDTEHTTNAVQHDDTRPSRWPSRCTKVFVCETKGVYA